MTTYREAVEALSNAAHLAAALEHVGGKCPYPGCGKPAHAYRRHTQYAQDSLNFGAACDEHEELDHAEMDERWREVGSGW